VKLSKNPKIFLILRVSYSLSIFDLESTVRPLNLENKYFDHYEPGVNTEEYWFFEELGKL
jgi:hypothetical protein